ncbi:MAG: hypothetical protein ACJ790_02975 [Myxococcaceae bacterium]
MNSYGNNGTQQQTDDSGSVGERMDQIGDSAQQLWTNARGAVTDLSDTLDIKGRVDRNPYLMLAAAAGVGYVLGGGLFTPLTARMIRLGIRLAALPLVKDELMGMAEAAVSQLAEKGGQGNGGSNA